MYSRKSQEAGCPVLDEKVILEIIYSVCGTNSCQIVSDVISASCNRESKCDKRSLDKCLLSPDALKTNII